MIEIHWLLILAIAMISGTCGFMLCALLTMAKMSDQAIEEMHQSEPWRPMHEGRQDPVEWADRQRKNR